MGTPLTPLKEDQHKDFLTKLNTIYLNTGRLLRVERSFISSQDPNMDFSVHDQLTSSVLLAHESCKKLLGDGLNKLPLKKSLKHRIFTIKNNMVNVILNP